MPSRHCLVQSLDHHAYLPSNCHSVPPRDHNSHVADQECHRLTIIIFAQLSVFNKLAITSQLNIVKVASSKWPSQLCQNYHLSLVKMTMLAFCTKKSKAAKYFPCHQRSSMWVGQQTSDRCEDDSCEGRPWSQLPAHWSFPSCHWVTDQESHNASICRGLLGVGMDWHVWHIFCVQCTDNNPTCRQCTPGIEERTVHPGFPCKAQPVHHSPTAISSSLPAKVRFDHLPHIEDGSPATTNYKCHI